MTGMWAALRRACAVLAGAAMLLTVPAATASAADTQAPAPARTVMILLDNDSSSDWVATGQQLALAYIHALPPNVYAGLMTFATRWRLVARPTTNRGRLEAAVSAVRGAGGVYYDSNGVYAALARVTSVVPRLRMPGSRLVVISDAENLKPVAFTPSVPTDVIAQRLDSDDYIGELFPLAYRTGGHVVARWSRGHLLGPQRVAALVTLVFGTPRAVRPPAARTPRPQAASPVGRASPSWPWALVAGLVALFAALLLIAMTAFGSAARASEERDLAGRIGQYGPQQPAAASTEEPADARKISRTAQGMTQRLMTPAAQERLANRLDLAGVASKPAEWTLLGGCLGVVIAAALSLVTSYVLVGVLVGALIAWLAMRLTLSMKIVRRRTAFGEQLPDSLQLIASSLRAGFSLPQALDAAVREGTQPLAGEFARAMSEVRLGGNLEDGLDGAANRMDSDDLRWTVTAIRIQQGVGGNLAEVLLTIAGTIRERAFLRRQVRALSAEGRLSAYILVALPVLIGIWLFVSAKEYMHTLYTTAEGRLMLLIATVLLVVGALWMRKMIKIKV